MQSDSVEPFSDNWTYLRAELNWLDRVLSLAIAKQRKDTTDIDRIAKSRVDRITSHWWKGLISVDGEISSDSPAEMPHRRAIATTKLSYQQQMDAKVQASRNQGIVLGIPSLCDRLQLSPFEKNLVLMTLAPEISRRYGRLYNYLQATEQMWATGLPTVDLLLRLLCRNDKEWRVARLCLSSKSALVQFGCIQIPASQNDTFLTRPVRLSDPLVDYLLADKPEDWVLERLLQPVSIDLGVPDRKPASLLDRWMPTVLAQTETSWANLVLPQSLLAALQHCCDRMTLAEQLDDLWDAPTTDRILKPERMPGSIVLLAGVAGTGKTTAVMAMAQALQVPLVFVDLKFLNVADSLQVFQEVVEQPPTILLLKSAQCWLGRSACLSPAEIHQVLQARRRHRGLTLLSVERIQAIQPHWRRQMSQVLEFPFPDRESRLRLWQQSFSPQVSFDTAIPWSDLAKLKLTGGEIVAIAREAAIYAIAESPSTKLGMAHILQALERIKP